MPASPSLIAAAIADAPAWALIGLTMPDEQMRERGAEELARWIAERLERCPTVVQHGYAAPRSS